MLKNISFRSSVPDRLGLDDAQADLID